MNAYSFFIRHGHMRMTKNKYLKRFYDIYTDEYITNIWVRFFLKTCRVASSSLLCLQMSTKGHAWTLTNSIKSLSFIQWFSSALSFISFQQLEAVYWGFVWGWCTLCMIPPLFFFLFFFFFLVSSYIWVCLNLKIQKYITSVVIQGKNLHM